jgi:cytochrome c oxidase subunit 4
MVTSHEEQQTDRHPTFMQYVLVAVILFVITIVEFLLIYEKVGINWEASDALADTKVPLLIALSAIKFGIVIMFYMHLKYDARLFSGLFVGGLALAISVVFALMGLFRFFL